jgi:hypothetical protein
MMNFNHCSREFSSDKTANTALIRFVASDLLTQLLMGSF